LTRYNFTINRLYLLGTVLSALLIAFFLIGVFYYNYKDFERDLEQIGQNYIRSQKQTIYQETQRALRYITHKYHKDLGSKDIDEIQREIVDAIEYMRNERDGTGYIFIYDENGVNIADPILKQNAGKNLLHFKDPNGKEVIRELIEVSKKSDGGFVEYVWNKPIENYLAPKISYAIFFQPLRWMIGTGVYLDTIEKEIAFKRKNYQDTMTKKALQLILFSGLLFVLMVIIYRYVTYKITTETDKIEKLFQKSSKDYEFIDEKQINLFEFRTIIHFANDMIKEIRLHKEKLEELNATLEARVETKTKKLQLAKEFSDKLLENQEKFIKNSIHEINTPLSIILTNIDLFKMKNGSNKYLTSVEAGVKIISNIYNDLSYLVKKDIVQYKEEVVDLSAFLIERVEFFDEIIKGNALEVILNIEPHIEVFMNTTVLQRLIDNNISNAIKYSLSYKPISIDLTKDDERIKLSFENYTYEIKNVENFFERFYRDNESRGGFGIGLHLVQEICSKNQITIDVQTKQDRVTFVYTWEQNYENPTT
jgi:signal transduction histidine kinase